MEGHSASAPATAVAMAGSSMSTTDSGDTSAGVFYLLDELSGHRCHDFCQRLHKDGYAIVRLPEAEFDELRALAREFFALPEDQKRAVTGESDAVGGEGVGYRDKSEADSEFLETFLTPAGDAHPEIPGRQLAAAIAHVHHRLLDIARILLRVCATHVRLPPEAMFEALATWAKPSSSVDVSEDAMAATSQEAFGSTLLRLCHYRGAQAAAVEADPAVLFLPHTDSTLLTLSPLDPTAPGLQLRRETDGGWFDVECLHGVSTRDIEVHCGDYLSILSRGYYFAMRHRVVRPAHGGPRISLPLLLRPRDEWRRNRGWLPYTEVEDSSSEEEDTEEAQATEEAIAAKQKGQ